MQTQTHARSVTQVWNLFHTLCWNEPGFCQDPDKNSINTQLSGQPLHPTDAGRVSTEKGKAVNRGKVGQKIFSASNRSLRLLTAAFVR